MREDIKSMTLPELQGAMVSLGQPAFRAGQIYTWLHRGARSFQEMTNLSKDLRRQLEERYEITVPQVVRKQESRKDGTVKYLWRLSDGNCVETVLMRYHYGNSVCISSEVGCPMGCAFCASTLGGLVRRLRPSEMLDQVLFTQLDSGLPISHIVLMGIGEPLDNFDTVLRFLELVNSPDGLNIGMRHISLSTCGLTEKIDKLADYQLQLTLSVSLHAPDDETRSRIMPVNRSVGVEKLFAACRRYFEKTGRRISYEYAMIDGVNDADWQADLLARHLKGTPGHVNLIPLNNVEESPSSPAGGWRPSRSGWRATASPPRYAASWGAILTPPAVSSAARQCSRNTLNISRLTPGRAGREQRQTGAGKRQVQYDTRMGYYRQRRGKNTKSGRFLLRRSFRAPGGRRRVRRDGRGQGGQYRQSHRRGNLRGRPAGHAAGWRWRGGASRRSFAGRGDRQYGSLSPGRH